MIKDGCEAAIKRLWERAIKAGFDEEQWVAAYAGAKEAARNLDGEVEGNNAIASLVTAYRQAETELRNEVARLKAEEDEQTSAQMRLIDKVAEAEEKKGKKNEAA